MDYKKKISKLPRSPGVYIFKDASGKILYIGKARNLKKRASSYFKAASRLPERLKAMVGQIERIEHIPTSTEAEALIYENNLIKQFSPKYNIALKDGKSYPLFKLTVNEKFPRLFITREKIDDGSLYYGPYADAALLRKALTALRRIFPLRKCPSTWFDRAHHRSLRAMVSLPRALSRGKVEPCLDYHLKQCVAPCAGLINEAKYKGIVSELKLFLSGKKKQLLKKLTERMISTSREKNYEEAGRLRDRLAALATMDEKRVAYRPIEEVDELKNILGIKKRIERIEAFDVSNVMGDLAVGGLVTFHKGRPLKDEYRRFRIKSVKGINDYAMMKEIVRRRYRRLINEKKRLPDLIIIDGGRGHLNAAIGTLEKLTLSDIPVVGIAKEFEHLYIKERVAPIILPKGSKALHLIECIRDEAHRFAIAYHRKLRSKALRSSS